MELTVRMKMRVHLALLISNASLDNMKMRNRVWYSNTDPISVFTQSMNIRKCL